MIEYSKFILEKLNTLLVVVNESGKVDYVSPSVKNILGYDPPQLLGGGWWNLTRESEEERISIVNFTDKILRGDAGVNIPPYERKLKTANGSYKWILWNTSKAPNNKMVAIGYDITDRKNAGEQLRQTNVALAKRNQEIVDSINYAKDIQESILPDMNELESSFADAFVLYKPKDIVSGDLYWFYKMGNRTFVAAIDCTGHGVPGALMSVVANSLLNEIIIKRRITDPAEILQMLDKELFNYINKKNRSLISNDGMDIAVCVFDFEKKKVSFSGAFRPLVYVRNNEVTMLKGNRFPIGFYHDVNKSFTTATVELLEGDAFYVFSDGYIDQFGGSEAGEEKFNRKRFRELLLTVQSMNMDEQRRFFEYTLANWKQGIEQTDDILVIGMKV